MPKPAKRRLITVLMTAGLLGGMVLTSPSAFADPDVPPPPVPVDPAAPDPLAPPMPQDPVALPPVADPLAPPAADPATPAPIVNYGAPAVIPEGTPAGQNPTPFTGEPPFLPPKFINPVNGSMVGVAKPIYIEFQRPIANRKMAEDAIQYFVQPAGSGPVLLGHRHPGALAPAGLLAVQHRGEHRRRRHEVQLPGGRLPGGHGR